MNGDVFADEALEHGFEAAHGIRETDDMRLENLAPAEGE